MRVPGRPATLQRRPVSAQTARALRWRSTGWSLESRSIVQEDYWGAWGISAGVLRLRIRPLMQLLPAGLRGIRSSLDQPPRSTPLVRGQPRCHVGLHLLGFQRGSRPRDDHRDHASPVTASGSAICQASSTSGSPARLRLDFGRGDLLAAAVDVSDPAAVDDEHQEAFVVEVADLPSARIQPITAVGPAQWPSGC